MANKRGVPLIVGRDTYILPGERQTPLIVGESPSGIVIALRARVVWYGLTTSSTVVSIIPLLFLSRWWRLRFSAHTRVPLHDVIQQYPLHAVRRLVAAAGNADAG